MGFRIERGVFKVLKNGSYVTPFDFSDEGKLVIKDPVSGLDAGESATLDDVSAEVSKVIDSAPAALNTLNELAAALGDDANFATTMTNALAGKADASHTHNYDNYNGWDLYTDGTSRGRITTGENVNIVGGTNVSLAYSSTNNTITISSVDTDTKYSVGDGGLTQKNFTTTLKTKLDGIATGATNTAAPAISSNGSTPSLASGITGAEVRSLIGAGTSNFNGSYTSLSNIPASFTPSAHTHAIDEVDGLVDALDSKVDDSQVLTNVPAGAKFTDTTYSVGDGGLTQKNFTSTLKSKLDGIATGANLVTNNNQLTNGAGYVTSTGTVAYAESAGEASYATNAGNAEYASSAGEANFALNAANSDFSAQANYASSAGEANYATNAASSTNATNATNAVNADKVDGYHASSLWRSDGAIWNPSANVKLNQSANSQEWSFDITRNGYTGGYWQVWDSANSTMLKVDAVNGKVYAPYNFVGNLEGTSTNATFAMTAESANNATYAETSGEASYANSSGEASYASSAGEASFATNAANADFSAQANYAYSAGEANYASSAGSVSWNSVVGRPTIPTFYTPDMFKYPATNIANGTNIRVNEVVYNGTTYVQMFGGNFLIQETGWYEIIYNIHIGSSGWGNSGPYIELNGEPIQGSDTMHYFSRGDEKFTFNCKFIANLNQGNILYTKWKNGPMNQYGGFYIETHALPNESIITFRRLS